MDGETSLYSRLNLIGICRLVVVYYNDKIDISFDFAFVQVCPVLVMHVGHVIVEHATRTVHHAARGAPVLLGTDVNFLQVPSHGGLSFARYLAQLTDVEAL